MSDLILHSPGGEGWIETLTNVRQPHCVPKQPDTRDRLFDIALRLFGRHGYGSVSIRAICREAGIRESSFYNHYPSKQALRDRVLAETDAHVVSTDYPLQPDQETTGMTSLQLLLASLATCSVNSLMLILTRRLRLQVTGLEVEALGQRRDEHPTVLTRITLAFRVRGSGLEEDQVAQALQIA